MASRMAARSATTGTPVKSCIRIRAGENAIWACSAGPCPPPVLAAPVVLAHDASAAMLSGGHIEAVFVAEQVLEQDLQREGEAADVEALVSELAQPVDRQGGAVDLQIPTRPVCVT